MALFRFLGSLRFTFLLLPLFIGTVAYATWIEGATQSHEMAEVIYHHPLFLLLLSFAFVNILLSSLSRYPFRKHHIPFLFTHLGLLLVLGGTLWKQQFGFQGSLRLVEGCGTNRLCLPRQKALFLQTGTSSQEWFSIPIDPDTPGNLPVPTSSPFKLHVQKKLPHVHPHYYSFHQQGHGFLLGHSIIEPNTSSSLYLGDKEFRVTTQEETPKKSNTLYLLGDAHATTLHVEGDGGENFSQTFSTDSPKSYYAYDRGFLGYTVPVSIPKKLFYTKEARQTYKAPYPKEAILSWAESGTWLSSFPWEPMNEELRPFAQWSWLLFSYLEEHMHETKPLLELQKRGWPFPLPETITSETLSAMQKQLFAMKEHLPDLAFSITGGQLVTALLRAQGIKPLDLFSSDAFEGETVCLEAPLRCFLEPTENSEDPEGVVLQIDNHGQTQTLALAYDESMTSFLWPFCNGTCLIRYQPHTLPLPHHLRLRQGRKVIYPETNLPASYEADVWIDGELCSLKMNQVIETKTGWRFYLAGLQGGDEEAKTVQIVANFDPVRYTVTYPGAFLVVLGTLLLFLRRKR